MEKKMKDGREATQIKLPKEIVGKIKEVKEQMMKEMGISIKSSQRTIPHSAVVEKLVDEKLKEEGNGKEGIDDD